MFLIREKFVSTEAHLESGSQGNDLLGKVGRAGNV